jgi:cell wall-associated NlpC family hydrolase
MSKGCVCVPVANLRREPEQSALNYESSDPLQESQLLYGELVELLEKQGDWWRVCALEQSRWCRDAGWTGYPGWIHSSQVSSRAQWWNPTLTVNELWTDVSILNGTKLSLSLGTRLERVAQSGAGDKYLVQLLNGAKGYVKASAVSSQCVYSADAMIAMGKQLLGHPYLWGGRSIYRPDAQIPLTGLDCSGLTQLLFRTQGIDIPRDAHDQYLKCDRIEQAALQLGDLVFTTNPQNPARMGHVMLYIGDGQVLEAARSFNCVLVNEMAIRADRDTVYGRFKQ